MKIIFFSTGEFGIPALKSVAGSEHDLVAVVTRPDQKKGRGWSYRPLPVKSIIEQIKPGIPVFQPESLIDESFQKTLNSLQADIFIVIDYGKKLPGSILGSPEKYSINLHPSLLPKYRGAAPVNWAIIKGEKETGNTVFRMNDKMDAGDIILQEKTLISEDETASELLNRLSQSGAKLVLNSLDLISKGEEELSAQNDQEASLAPKLSKKDGIINWNNSADVIEKNIRGLLPWPCAFTTIEGKMLKIFSAEILRNVYGSTPGTIVDTESVIVATGKDALKLKKVQLEGKRAMTAKEFIKGCRFEGELILGQ